MTDTDDRFGESGECGAGFGARAVSLAQQRTTKLTNLAAACGQAR